MTKTAQKNEKMLAMNEALTLGSLRQHELTEAAEDLNVQLQKEIAERKLVEKKLRESEDRYRNLFNSMDEGYCIIEMMFDKYEKPVDYRFLEVNRAFEKQSGMHDVTGKRMLEFVTEIEEHWLVNYGKVALTGEPVRFANEYKSLGRWFDVYAFKIGEPERRRVAILFTDITNQRKAEERQRLLTKELAHRGNNLLAIIQSIATRSLSGNRSLAEARDVLRERIQALARSQSVLLGEGFEGAPVSEIVRLEFEAFSGQVKAAGPDVMLNSRAAQTFALLVHELATNATKHGAMSLPGGHVAIQWSAEGVGAEARFKFQWQERDGPPVIPPTRQGFGRTLLERVVGQEFGAPPKISFAPEGLSYEIDVPLSAVAAESAGVTLVPDDGSAFATSK